MSVLQGLAKEALRYRDQWSRFREVLRWRGPFRTFLLIVREIFRPIAYWYIFYIVENDLTRDLPKLYAKGHFVVKIHVGDDELKQIGARLSAMGELTIDEIKLRSRRGDLVGVAYAGTEPVGYSWMTCSSGLPLAFDVTWIIHPNEAVLYGSYVRKAWRGRGIHSCLDVALNKYAREHGIVRTVASMSVLNNQTLALARRTAKSKTMIDAFVHFCFVNKTWGRPFACFEGDSR